MVDYAALLEVSKSIFQILFWLAAGTVAVLSYRQARKTIFQPAKNEVFKVQVETLQRLMNELNWKSSLEAWELSGMEESWQLSTSVLFKAYARDQFSAEVRVKGEEKTPSFATMVPTNTTLFSKLEGPADEVLTEGSGDQESGSVCGWDAQTWESFEISLKLYQVQQVLQEAANDPVVPQAIIARIEALERELHATTVRALEDLKNIARQLPRHYPNVEDLNGASLSWAGNMRVERGEKLYEKQSQLKREIRDYLHTDRLFGS